MKHFITAAALSLASLAANADDFKLCVQLDKAARSIVDLRQSAFPKELANNTILAQKMPPAPKVVLMQTVADAYAQPIASTTSELADQKNRAGQKAFASCVLAKLGIHD
jgi:hypothetical protein